MFELARVITARQVCCEKTLLLVAFVCLPVRVYLFKPKLKNYSTKVDVAWFDYVLW